MALICCYHVLLVLVLPESLWKQWVTVKDFLPQYSTTHAAGTRKWNDSHEINKGKMRPVLVARLKALQHSDMRTEKVRPLWEPEQYSEHQVSPARFETFKLLYKEGFKHLCTLKEWCVIGVVITAVVKDFGHIGHKLCQLVVMSLLQTGFHCRKVCKGEKYVNMFSLHCNRNITNVCG